MKLHNENLMNSSEKEAREQIITRHSRKKENVVAGKIIYDFLV